MELSWVRSRILSAWSSNNFRWFLPVACLKSMEFWVLSFTICLVCATIFVWERLRNGGRRVSLRPPNKTRYLKCVEELLKSVDEFSKDCGSMQINRERCQLLCSECLSLVQLTQPHIILKESFCAIRRALKLVKDCRSGDWLLKAVEFGNCQRHFLEILLDLHRLPIVETLIGSGEELLDDRATEFNISKKTESELDMAWESDKADLSSKLKSVSERDRWLAYQLEPTANSDDILVAPAEIGKHVTEFDMLKSKYIYKRGKIFIFRVTLDCNKECVMKVDFGSVGAEVPEDSKNTELQEADFMKLCRHPYAVALLGFWERTRTNGPRVPLLLMESMGYDLDSIIKANKSWWWWPWGGTGGFPALIAINLVLPVAKVMKYLHKIGVVHLDLKPKNILYTRVPGERDHPDAVSVKLADFGDARMAKDGVITKAGTSGYMDPDMWAKKGSVDLVKADIFSFGMVFGEVLTGLSPMEALGCESSPEFYGKLQRGEPLPLPKETPMFVKSIVESCLKLKPDERPSFNNVCWKLQNTELLLLNGWT